jgi:hypothetical protein
VKPKDQIDECIITLNKQWKIYKFIYYCWIIKHVATLQATSARRVRSIGSCKFKWIATWDSHQQPTQQS